MPKRPHGTASRTGGTAGCAGCADAGRTSLYRTIVPEPTLWLPKEEGARLRFEFEAEMERLAPAQGRDCA